MKTEYILLKETALNNNCPECYSNDSMVLSFKQQRLKSRFLVKTKAYVIESIECQKCENTIFPGQWTQDIERVYDYHKKTLTPKSGSLHFTGLFYGLLLVIVLLAGAGYLYMYRPDLLGL